MTTSSRPVLVVEDDPFLRLVQVVLDPETSPERHQAFAYFMAHDEPDFDGWRDQLRNAAGALYPAEVRLVESQEQLQRELPAADAVVVESLRVGREELAEVPQLRVVQKYGALTRNVDLAACAERGVPVRTLRRRANISCAEHAIALMLTLARKLHRVGGLISVEQLTEAGYAPTDFDRRHTAGSGWARISGLGVLYESTLGIIGLGEIGTEIALRAFAFGMRVLYYQRTRLPEAEERLWNAEYVPLNELLERSDWVVPQLPASPSTHHLIGWDQLARMKPGACLVNVSRAEVVDREALLAALATGHLGGFGLDPQYEEPGRPDDPLLRFDNVVLTPHTAAQPRFNALKDIAEMIVGLAHALSA